VCFLAWKNPRREKEPRGLHYCYGFPYWIGPLRIDFTLRMFWALLVLFDSACDGITLPLMRYALRSYFDMALHLVMTSAFEILGMISAFDYIFINLCDILGSTSAFDIL